MLISGWNKYGVILPFIAVVSFLVAGCGESKFYQCQQILNIATETTNRTKKISENGKTKNPKEVLEVADAFESVARDLESLEIQDKKLQEYQNGLIEFYRNQARATRDFIAAFNRRDVASAKSAKDEVQRLGNMEKDLVNGINSYCQEN